MTNLPKPPPVPCGSCPYRKDTPSGIWDRDEYEKLPPYDNETGSQPFGVFMCHQRDGCLCGGWLMTHDVQHLLSLRLARVHDSAFDYHPDVEVFASGREAHDHGVKDLDEPSLEAHRRITGLLKLPQIREPL
jgi:hypothetical protein